MPSKKPRKPTRRARGTGTIFWHEGKEQWVGRVVIGRKPNGKPKYKECWARSQGEVVKRMAAAELPGPDTTVHAWATRWLATLTVRPSTRRGYVARLNDHILPNLGHLRLVAVNAADVEGLAAKLLNGTGQGDGLEVSTVNGVLGTARTMFGAAVRARVIPQNPVADARKPKQKKKKVEPYTPAQLRAFIDAADWYSASRVVALMAAVGCRVGEALALDVPDLDPKAGTISITKTLVPVYGIGPTKSENSTRTIRVPAPALPMLRAAAGTRRSGPLFCTSKGKRFPAQNVDGALRRMLRDMKLPARGTHQLRHSVASQLVAAGVPLADAAKYIGDDVATFVRTYVHPAGSDPAAALEKLYGGREVGAEGAA